MSNSPEQLKESASIRRRRRVAVGRARLVPACLLVTAVFGQLTAAARQPARPAGNVTDGQDASTTLAPPAQTPVAARARARTAPPVIAVIHRLRGWKLRALVTPPDAPFAAAFDDKFVRLSVVAGYVLPDGRSVVARLPRAEAEMLNVSTLFPDFYEPPAQSGESGLMLMKQDGGQVPVKFIGYDSGTGLSLLEASEPFLTGQVEQQELPAVGQRVWLVAPLPAAVTEALSATGVETVEPAAGGQGPVGVSGVLYMSLAEIEGRLQEVNRSPAGRAVSLTLQIERASSPEWAGSIALSEAGSLVGIVERSAGREARLLPAQSVRAAAERVKARRRSVPQPWLGARGDAVAGSQMEFFISQGWPRAQAGELLRRQQGVLLTAVAPGTPAARAGLRPGDVVSRIDNFEVRSVEDMSLLLKEAGNNRLAEFMIHRAHESPRSLRVRLSESQNPALETARAEALAAEAAARSAEAEVRRLDVEIAALDMSLSSAQRDSRSGSGVSASARRGETAARLAAERRKLDELRTRLDGAESSFLRARALLEEAASRISASGDAGSRLAASPLLPFGIEAMAFDTVTVENGRRSAKSGLVVAGVRPGSPAALAGVLAGDVVESVDGEARLGLDWRLRLQAPPPAEVKLGLVRDGKPVTITLRRAPQK